MTEVDQMHIILMERNINHLQQAQNTPFGSGLVHGLLQNPVTREETINSMLDGTFEMKHPKEAVND